MRVLVTGADGFVGRHLCRELQAKGHSVVPVGGPGAQGMRVIELTEPMSLFGAVEEARAEGVIHLAGQSSVARSHAAPDLTLRINALGTANLLLALREKSPASRVLLVGSGEMYGPIPQGQAAREDWPLLPTSPYAASKVAAELFGFQFWRSYKMQVMSARPFNHLGQGQDSTFVVPSFAGQLAAIREGKQEPVLRTGDLTPVRDFSHVLDVVAGYILLLERGEAGQAYNVGSGVGRSIQSLLDAMLTESGVKVRLETDPARLRPVEIPFMVGDATKLRALGWKPTRTVEDALRDVLKEHRAL